MSIMSGLTEDGWAGRDMEAEDADSVPD